VSIWIDSNAQLQTLCDQLSNCSLLAVDTEFIRTDTFYPKIALIQLSDGEHCWLIDVLAIDDFLVLKELLESSEISLIFHACAEDLEVLDHALNIQPTKIFDTQIAAGITNIGYCMGYARLVEALLDIKLDKQETRSNWLARPLTERQLEYATLDVLYLHKLHNLLSLALDDQQRRDWFSEETKSLTTLVAERKNNQNYYQRIKGAWRLSAQSLTVLAELCQWREAMARSRDIPRSRIAKDTVLFEIARQLPETRRQLFDLEDWPSGAVKRYADAVLKQIAIAKQQTTVPALPQPLSKNKTAILKKMRNAMLSIAEDRQIPSEFLCNKKELEAILRSSDHSGGQWPVRLTDGWRRLWVKPAIEAVLDKANLRCDLQ
jgi:ribonuclease D